MYKSQHNKPLILNEKDIESAKPHVKKNIKYKICWVSYFKLLEFHQLNIIFSCFSLRKNTFHQTIINALNIEE